MEIADELVYLIALNKIDKIGPVLGKNLIAYLGSAQAVFETPKGQLQKIPGIGPALSKKIDSKKNIKQAEDEIILAKKNGVEIVSFYHEKYPKRIKQIRSSPLVLYMKGEFKTNPPICISIVGSRKPNTYGLSQVEKFVSEIAPYQPQIVSGMAYGIDIHAHQMALKYGLPTVGVLANGLDSVYPKSHHHIAGEMIREQGGLISEFPLYTSAERENFPKRNRLIAAYCDVLFVAQTETKGGSIITANLAFDYDKTIFALPGRISEKKSQGCHMLINQNKAYLYENIAHFLEEMQWITQVPSPKKQAKNKLQNDILLLLEQYTSLSLLDISTKLSVAPQKISIEILHMELENLLTSAPGNKYSIC